MLLAILAGAGCHAAVSWLVRTPEHRRVALTAAAFIMIAGLLLVARAVIGLLVVRVSRSESPGTSALALTLGPVLIAYGSWAAGTVLSGRNEAHPRVARFAQWHASPGITRLRRIVAVVTAGLVLVGLFWAANSFAWAFGQGRAVDDALELPGRREVVLDTKEPLVELPVGVSEALLPAGSEEGFRYYGLRLLVAAGDRLFLVPAEWTEQGRTLVVPYDDQIRIQLVPPRSGYATGGGRS